MITSDDRGNSTSPQACLLAHIVIPHTSESNATTFLVAGKHKFIKGFPPSDPLQNLLGVEPVRPFLAS